MGGLSTFHWLIVLVVVFLLFGNRLPSVMRSLGRGVTEFKKGMEGVDDEDEPKRVPKEPPKDATSGPSATPTDKP
ncbi:MAG: twin-arginine translocase TatA/TatE family subunit [Tepidisphaeraceae bacterium]|jgi:sec-independent protein translocase protein TatA